MSSRDETLPGGGSFAAATALCPGSETGASESCRLPKVMSDEPERSAIFDGSEWSCQIPRSYGTPRYARWITRIAASKVSRLSESTVSPTSLSLKY